MPTSTTIPTTGTGLPATNSTAQPVAGTVAQPISSGALTAGAPLPWQDSTTVPEAPAPAQATAAPLPVTANATPASVDPNALSNQVGKVTDPNSQIMQQATAQANESSNSKGLLNSSMAVGAARNAVLSAALPIAQGDVNAQEQNAQNAQQTGLQNAQQANAMGTVKAQLGTQVNTTNAAATNSQIMAQLTQANQVQLAGVNTKYQSYLNSSASASTLYNTYVTQIGQIQSNPNLDTDHKTLAINLLVNKLHDGLQNMSAISGLNLSAGLYFPPAGGTSKGGTSSGVTLPGISGTIPPPTTPTPGSNVPGRPRDHIRTTA